MSLSLPGVETIESSDVARARARRWRRMARELDTPDAPESAQTKMRELRQRAAAAEQWARHEEDARVHAQTVHDEEARKVVPIRDDDGGRVKHPGRVLAEHAGNRAYHAARPPAMRVAHRGRQHVFQGTRQVFPAQAGADLFFEAIGMTLAVVLFGYLLRAPRVLSEGSSHLIGFLGRASEPYDPLTKTKLAVAGGGPAPRFPNPSAGRRAGGRPG